MAGHLACYMDGKIVSAEHCEECSHFEGWYMDADGYTWVDCRLEQEDT